MAEPIHLTTTSRGELAFSIGACKVVVLRDLTNIALTAEDEHTAVDALSRLALEAQQLGGEVRTAPLDVFAARDLMFERQAARSQDRSLTFPPLVIAAPSDELPQKAATDIASQGRFLGVHLWTAAGELGSIPMPLRVNAAHLRLDHRGEVRGLQWSVETSFGDVLAA